ncbi:Retrovirus-related Pol polyprotein from transposon RE2 [Vitis vinifera]|uniref:Retrovirus-related Pol polyprotein from transposon RE2 n=1 Tax=Vitis vinifera TaxID=29760 RepID=A0A438DQ69_VITVI|nr:Retrovirus-related Pol polyprotein from transposon RE2 [Vitis vinifera]
MDQLQQVLARGTKKGRLYALEENVIQAMIVTRSSKASSEVWHQHMGHPQTKSIKLLQDKNFIEMPIEMVSFSTSDASCETSKIDHQTKSWKENTANQSSNSKKCNHCPCTTEQRNQFSGEERIYASCNTNQNTEASCVNPIGTPTVVAAKISIIAASTNDQNIVITTETPTNVALGASGHNSNIATTIGTLSQIEFTSSYKHANGQHTDNKGTHMITRSKLKKDPSLKSQMVTFAATRSNDNNIISDLISTLSSEFSLKDLGSLHYFREQWNMESGFSRQSSLRLTSFCDADWAGCTNIRRSTSGYCIFLGANCISWSSKRQPTVSRSSAEAEYRSFASSAVEITWLTFLLRDIGIRLCEPPQLLCGNLNALHMIVNPVFHAHSKHIELDYHYVPEKVASGVLITHFLPSSLQVANIFTKALPKTSFQVFRFKLGVHKLPLTSLRGADKGNSNSASIQSMPK